MRGKLSESAMDRLFADPLAEESLYSSLQVSRDILVAKGAERPDCLPVSIEERNAIRAFEEVLLEGSRCFNLKFAGEVVQDQGRCLLAGGNSSHFALT